MFHLISRTLKIAMITTVKLGLEGHWVVGRKSASSSLCYMGGVGTYIKVNLFFFF